jgi:ABC-2 type transport system permease protein
MSDSEVIYALWYREVIKWVRDRSRIIGSIATPLIFLAVFGIGFGSSVPLPGVNYTDFVFPGIVAMSILFSSIFFGVSIVWDRQFGFLKEILVAPVSRVAVFTGKVLGGATMSIVQGVIILSLAFAINVNLTFGGFLLILPLMFLLSAGVVSMGLMIGSYMKSAEGFQVIMTFLVMPMFLFSGAFFPLTNLPNWMDFLVKIDPMTYAVDGMRNIILNTSTFDLGSSFAALLLFAVVMIVWGGYRFRKIQ